MKKRLIMLVGVPGSGKSTYIKQFLADKKLEDWVVLSSDDYIERKAAEEGKTYSEVFSKYVGAASTNLELSLKRAVKQEKNIIWDQTNLTSNVRKKKLAQIPKEYHFDAVYFPVPSNLQERLDSRPGKTIPKKVLESMIQTMEMPSFDEGFSRINIERHL